jgi:hypothetical protein
MATLRLRLKNLKTVYALRPNHTPENIRVVERIGKGPYDLIQTEIAAVLDAHEGDIPVDAVYGLATKFNRWAFNSTDEPVPATINDPIAVEMARLAALYMHEVFFGVAMTLGLLAEKFDPDWEDSDEDLEEFMARSSAEDEPAQ